MNSLRLAVGFALVTLVFAMSQAAFSASLQDSANQGRNAATDRQLLLPSKQQVLIYGSRGYESQVYSPSAYGPPAPQAEASPHMQFYARAFSGPATGSPGQPMLATRGKAPAFASTANQSPVTVVSGGGVEVFSIGQGLRPGSFEQAPLATAAGPAVGLSPGPPIVPIVPSLPPPPPPDPQPLAPPSSN